MQIKNTLVVCIVEYCSCSPMAEYLLKQQYPQLNIESAGIFGVDWASLMKSQALA